MFGTHGAKSQIMTLGVWGLCLLGKVTQRAVGKPAAIPSMDRQPYSEDVGKKETLLQPFQVELTQHSALSYLDEVLFDLDGPGQGLYI